MQAAQCALDLRDIQQRIDQSLDQFAVRQAAQRRLGGGQRGHQQHLGHGGGRRAAVRCVDLLGQSVAPIGDIAGDGVGVGRVDLADFLDRRLIVEVEVLKADQERVAVAGHRAAHREPQQADQRARLLVAPVLGESRDDVADRGVERVGLADALDEGLGRGRDGIDPLRLLERRDIGLRDFVDAVLRRQAVEQALADDGEHLAGVLLHRRDRLGVAVVVLGQVLDQGAELARAVEIDIVLEVGDDDAGARAAWQRIEQPLQRADREIAERRRADRFALRHLEVARQFVEQDQDRLRRRARRPIRRRPASSRRCARTAP